MLWLLPLVVIGGLLVTAVVLALLGWLGDVTDRHQHAAGSQASSTARPVERD
jgi:hypothetical protein